MKTIFLILFTSVFALGAAITDDKLQVGKPTSSGDKILEFKGPTSKRLKRNVSTNELSYDGDAIKLGDGTNTEKKITFDKGANSPVMRWNNATSKLEFSNDGTIYKAFGSGSGSGSGGINLLPNPGFEDGLTGYTNTGGTVAVVDTGSNLLFDLKSVTFTATAGSQNFRSDAITIPEGLKGQNCLVKLTYKGGDSNLTLSVTDGSDVQIPNSQAPTIIASSIAKEISASFICPTSGSLKWKLSSGAAAALISLDNVHLGSNIDVFQVSQAAHIGSLKYAGAVNCYFSATGATYQSYSADTDCATPTVSGVIQAPSTKIPAFKMDVVAGQTYRITAKGFIFAATGTGGAQWRFSDGTDSSEIAGAQNSVSGVYGGLAGVLSAIYKPTTSGLKTIELQAKYAAGNADIDVGTSTDLIFEIEQFPSVSQLAINSVNSNHGWIEVGPMTIEATTTSPTKGTVVTDSVKMKRQGDTGFFEFSYEQSAAGAAGSGDYLFKLPNGLQFDASVPLYSVGSGNAVSEVALQKAMIGYFHIGNGGADRGSGACFAYDSTHFRCSAAAFYTSYVMFGSAQYTLGAGALGFKATIQAKINGWIESNLNAPVLVGGVSTGSNGVMRIESASISDVGTVTNESSDWINGNCTNANPRVCTIASGMFTSTPVCIATGTDPSSTPDTYPTLQSISSTGFSVQTNNHLPGFANVANQRPVNIFCMGPK